MVLKQKEIKKRVLDSYELLNNVLKAVPEPVVSVGAITYQHNRYIKNCIEGVLAQKTDFPIEFIIEEDCSTDGTREIVFEYAEKYPDIIRVITADYNVGASANGRRVRWAARGKYLAICNGDDYWTDSKKLQKQVNYLEANAGYKMCFHPVYRLDQETGEMKETYYGAPGIKKFYTLDDLLEYSNFIPESSKMVQNRIVREVPDFYFKSPAGDYIINPLTLIYSNTDKIGFINEFMGVYRRHSASLMGGANKIESIKRVLKTMNVAGEGLNLKNRTAWKRGQKKKIVSNANP
jgi:glycosyltransferase involved in cell wall biosynthesis